MLLNQLFGSPEEINGGDRCPTYMYRWFLFRCPWFKVYLHKIVGDDWTRDLHDHPKRFISVGLRGSYQEERVIAWYDEETPITRLRRFTAPWVRTFPPEHIHRITTPWGTCWTLVIVLKEVRVWGFWHKGKLIPWRDYVTARGGPADKMKSCD